MTKMIEVKGDEGFGDTSDVEYCRVAKASDKDLRADYSEEYASENPYKQRNSVAQEHYDRAKETETRRGRKKHYRQESAASEELDNIDRKFVHERAILVGRVSYWPLLPRIIFLALTAILFAVSFNSSLYSFYQIRSISTNNINTISNDNLQVVANRNSQKNTTKNPLNNLGATLKTVTDSEGIEADGIGGDECAQSVDGTWYGDMESCRFFTPYNEATMTRSDFIARNVIDESEPDYENVEVDNLSNTYTDASGIILYGNEDSEENVVYNYVYHDTPTTTTAQNEEEIVQEMKEDIANAIFLGIMIAICPIVAPLFLISLVNLILTIIRVCNTKLAITNKRIRGRTGIIRVNEVAYPLDRIDCINAYQTFFGRIFNYANIGVSTASSNVKFKYIKQPKEFQRAANDQIEINNIERMNEQAIKIAEHLR